MNFEIPHSQCRVCQTPTRLVKRLGNFASCGIFPDSQQEEVPLGRLEINICPQCELVQLSNDFDFSFLFTQNYGYLSSLNESMVKHLELIAREVKNYFNTDGKNFFHLDIGSNDGTLLNLVRDEFKKNYEIQINQFGVDPIGEKFIENYKTAELISGTFSLEMTNEFSHKFDVITSIAMLYDLPDPINFFMGIKKILSAQGIWISEQSYLYAMIKNNSFDTICHEHLEYYSLKNIIEICELTGLEIFDVELNQVNGGSFRFFAQHKNGPQKQTRKVVEMIENERKLSPEYELSAMFERIEIQRYEMIKFLDQSLKDGLKVHGYGASTKGNTLLQFYEITPKILPFIAERNSNKFSKVTPGTKIPIISEEQSKSLNPDAYVVLPWHFKPGILAREKMFIESTRTKFYFPLPTWGE